MTAASVTFDTDGFIDGYIEAALWADVMRGEDEEIGGGEGLDLRPGAREKMVERGQVHDFIEANQADLAAYCEQIKTVDDSPPEAYAGHDFWLTRNGHGAGFWDRGLGDLGDRLTAATKPYGSGDDHRPYDCGDGTADV